MVTSGERGIEEGQILDQARHAQIVQADMQQVAPAGERGQNPAHRIPPARR